MVLAMAHATSMFNLPPGMLSAVCYIESGHHANAYNANDEGTPSHGACQMKYTTAKLLGFKGKPKDLQFSEVNTYYAAKYLRKQLDRYDQDEIKAIAAYNSGKLRIRKGKIANKKYVDKVLYAWRQSK